MNASIENDEVLILRLEALLARWDRSGEETYRELAESLLRCIRESDSNHIPKE